MEREDLVNRLRYLDENAKYVFWPVDSREDDNGYDDSYAKLVIDEWLLVWYPQNENPIPTLQAINDIDNTALADFVEAKRKEARNALYKNDLTVLAAFNIYKMNNPTKTLSDYLDYLESIQT